MGITIFFNTKHINMALLLAGLCGVATGFGVLHLLDDKFENDEEYFYLRYL